MTTYRPVDPKADFPAMERRVLDFWSQGRIFERSLELRANAPRWVFYEGPPTANGKPGIHHVESRTFKDLFPRFKTMTGHLVERKGGWDCHGLPVEVQIEREIGTRSKRDIEAFGVAKFIELCRASVVRYVEDWRRLTERIAFWLDLDQAYWTMDPGYVQSVWWALKRLHEQGLLYRDDKVTAYCPRCGTGLSDHEVALGYTTVTDPSAYVRFPVVEGPERFAGASLAVWTTTPWTLISNQGAAVAADEPYVRVRVDGQDVIVAEALKDVSGEGELGDRFTGADLVGVRYEPPFENIDGSTHRVVAAGFVSMNEGTGIVHMAPAFGAEDLEVGRREGWPVFNPVDEEGKFTDLAPEFVRGRFVKDADPAIIDDLQTRGLLLRAEQIEHTYPLCWRCDTPLLYYARAAWYIRTTARKDEMLRANETMNWYPEHIKHGRFGDWLANNIDWSLSRERYWGTPLPVWTCGQGHVTVVGELDELSTLAGRDVTGVDPHRPAIDEVTFACPDCGQESRRVSEVIDAWFDSGAMPFAQWGYRGPDSPTAPVFDERFPADFIAEALDQTRGWFYSLLAEGVLLFGQPAYRNVLCLGLLVDRGGRKMSKRLGNIIDPWDVIDRFGADALRWSLISSGSPWADRRVFMEAFEKVVREFLLTLWNTYSFHVQYANIDDPDPSAAPPPSQRPLMDRWVLSQLHSLVAEVREDLERYDATGGARRIAQFVDDLSNWYVRRSRRRFWDPARAGASGDEASVSKVAAYATLRECLVTLSGLLAPFIPFVSEELYGNLVAGVDPSAPVSVHLTDFPVADPGLVDRALDEAMGLVRQAVRLGLRVRTEARIRVRQPLLKAVLHLPGEPERLAQYLPIVAEELNVKEVSFAESAEELAGWRAKPNFRRLGPILGSRVQEVAGALAEVGGTVASRLAGGESVTVETASGPVKLEPEDVELVQETRSGWGVASDGTVTVALDLEVTDDLRAEGKIRELIHHVQALRKAARLAVTDRIVLGIEAEDDGLRQALADRRDQLAGEVLATEVVEGAVQNPAATVQVEVDGVRLTLSLRKA